MSVEPRGMFERARLVGWRDGRLTAMLFLSLVAHVLLAYAVLVQETTPTVRWPQDARIAVVTTSGPHQQLLDWVANNDPANVFLPHPAGHDDLGVAFAPSFREARADLRGAEEPRSPILLPDLRAPASKEDWFRLPSVVSRPKPTFQIALYALGDAEGEELLLYTFAIPDQINLKEVQRPTRLHLRRAAEGAFSIAMVMESSGSAPFDVAARDALARAHRKADSNGARMSRVEARLVLKKENEERGE